jgi:hypothetical protein
MAHSVIRKGIAALAALAALSLGASASPQQESGQDSGRQQGATQQGPTRVHRSESLQKVRSVIDNMGSKSWDDILSDDVRLTLKTAAAERDDSGNVAMVSYFKQIHGKDAVEKALADIHKNLHTQTTITSELISGDEAVLIGDVTFTRPEGSGKKHHDGHSPSAESGQKGEGGTPEAHPQDQYGKAEKQSEQGTRTKTLPIAIQLHFNDADKVDRIVITTANVRSAQASSESKESKEPQQK